MRDVIVIGAGGGGPVVAKELAARGLDVLLLEAGPRHADPEQRVDPLRERRQQPADGLLPLRSRPTAASRPGCGRRRRTRSCGSCRASAAPRSTTTATRRGHTPACSPATTAPDAGAYDTAHLFPFTYDELVPYYEWVEAHAAGADRGHGHQGGGVLPRRRGPRPAGPDDQGHHPRLVPPAGERHPPARRHGRADRPTRRTCTTRRPPAARSAATASRAAIEPRAGAPQPQGQALHRQQLRADGAHRRRWAATGGRPVTLVTDAFVTQVHTEPRNGEHTVARA